MSTYLNHSNDTVSVPLNVILPSTFKVEFDMLFTQQANNSCLFRIGETDSKALLVGKVVSGDSNYKVYARNGSDLITTGSAITLSSNWQSMFMSYDGTTFNFNDDITVTNFNGVTLDTLLNVVSWKSHNTSGQVRNIKVKPL